jgi:hydrogenase nickel incorporation protein HypB
VVNKHPMMFRGGNIGVINKIDLAGSSAPTSTGWSGYAPLQPEMKVFKTNMKTGKGSRRCSTRSSRDQQG